MRGSIVARIAMPIPPKMNMTHSQKYGATISILVSFGCAVMRVGSAADTDRIHHQRNGGREFSGAAI